MVRKAQWQRSCGCVLGIRDGGGKVVGPPILTDHVFCLCPKPTRLLLVTTVRSIAGLLRYSSVLDVLFASNPTMGSDRPLLHATPSSVQTVSDSGCENTNRGV